MRWAGVVVAGGGSRRFGADKLAARLRPLPDDPLPDDPQVGAAGSPVGPTLLAATTGGLLAVRPAPQLPVVVVGPPRADLAADHRVRFTLEEPRGSGPATAVLAGAAAVPDAEVLVVVPGDAPFAAEAVPRLLAALLEPPDVGGRAAGTQAAVAVDDGGRRQHLLLAVRRDALGAVRLGPGAPARALLAGLRVVEVPVTARESLDVDDPAALDRAVAELGRSS